MVKKEFFVPEISCSSCVAKIKNSLSKSKDVKSIEIKDKNLSLNLAKYLTSSQIKKLMPKGYSLKQAKEEVKEPKSSIKEFIPLVVVFIYVFISAILFALLNTMNFDALMRGVLGFFFIYFSLFKFLDLKGFKQGFSTYDPLAKKIGVYGYLYPFLELVLGIFYLTNNFRTFTLITTIIILSITIIGIIPKLIKKSAIQCACLGTVLKLPLTKVTLIENSVMIVMAIFMLF